MKVLITGGAGFLGQKLAARLIDAGSLSGRPIESLVLFDRVAARAQLTSDPRVKCVVGDICDPTTLEMVIGERTDAIFHLASIVSAQAEEDFDLGMRVNVQATISLLEAARRLDNQPIVVFTSSVAAYGGDIPSPVTDQTILSPRSSYGTQKVIGELLISDYSRKGFIDGRVVRLPTIVVRPGKPNKAASSFASGILREPLSGQQAVCPVAVDSSLWVMSPRKAIDALEHAHGLRAEAIGDNRSIALPGLTVTVAEMLSALERIAGPEVASRVTVRPDPAIEAIVLSWPDSFTADRGASLGFAADSDIGSVIEQFIEDELPGGAQR
jgi:nucleoside-diphosphate-sugar epimerase